MLRSKKLAAGNRYIGSPKLRAARNGSDRNLLFIQATFHRLYGQPASAGIPLLRITRPFILLFILAASAHAADHYVRQGAAGNGSGSDWTNAYAALPASLVRGDTYYVADGNYGGYTFDDPVSGTSVITIRKATAASHGTAAGWSDAYGDGQAQFTGLTFGTSYFNFDGVTGGGPGQWNSGHGFQVARTISSNSGELVTLSGGVSNVAIRHTEITGMNTNDANKLSGIKGTFGNSNLTFSYNNIHTLYGVHFHIGSWQNVVIEYSRMAYNRSTPEWHTEGISSIGTNDNITIRHCLWQRVQGTAVIAGVNGGTSTNWKVYGNIFSHNNTGPILYYNESGSSNQQSMHNLDFHNNVVTGVQGGSQGGILIQSGSNNRISNNIWYDNVMNALTISGTKNSNYFSRNVRTESCSPPCDKNPEGASGDPNAQITTVNPFVNWNTANDPVTANFHLAAPTQAGQTLASPFNVDPAGTTRGADGVWDRGVYEYGSGTPPPPPNGSACDLNNDSNTNVSDVQLCANQAIGSVSCTTGDINNDSACNVVDVQRVVNAALGGSCVTQ